jgi:hypothetical protein
MAVKFDGVIEAARYAPDGRLVLIRAYERRGPAFSDLILLDRRSLVQLLKKGKRFVVGERLAHLGGTFKTGSRVKLVGSPGQEQVVTDGAVDAHDHLENVPLF